MYFNEITHLHGNLPEWFLLYSIAWFMCQKLSAISVYTVDVNKGDALMDKIGWWLPSGIYNKNTKTIENY